MSLPTSLVFKIDPFLWTAFICIPEWHGTCISFRRSTAKFQNYKNQLEISNRIEFNLKIQVTATDGDKDRAQNIVYFLTGQGIDPDNPANSKFDINRTTGEIYVLKVY